MTRDAFVGRSLAWLCRLVAGAAVVFDGYTSPRGSRVYFANHTSHFDFIVLWSALPTAERTRTRPVAGSDYWDRGATRRYLSRNVFRAVLVDRTGDRREANPVDDMAAALAAGDSLILFPEGTRGDGYEIAEFKSGIYHLAKMLPDVELVPVMMENLSRILPKGEIVPVPLLSTIILGAPIRLMEGEEKSEFLARARAALLALRRA